MAKEEAGRYEVVITSSAEVHFYELVEYLYEHMSLDRAEEVTRELNEMTWVWSCCITAAAWKRN